MGDSLVPKVRAWLDSQGFSLELRAAAAFRRADFEVEQSVHFDDLDGGSRREIDVLARYRDGKGIIDIRLFVECKSSRNPWVLLSSGDSHRELTVFPDFCALSSIAVDVLELRRHEAGDPAAWRKRIAWMDAQPGVGYALRQAFTDRDTAYAAQMQLARACSAYLKLKKQHFIFMFAFPVLVVDAPIVRCSLGKTADEDIAAEEISRGEVLFTAYPGFRSLIRVVHVDALDLFVSEARGVCEQIRGELAENEAQFIAAGWRGPEEG